MRRELQARRGLSMCCCEQASDQCAPAGTVVPLQSNHAPTDQIISCTFDYNVLTVAGYWAEQFITKASNSDPANAVGLGCSDDPAAM